MDSAAEEKMTYCVTDSGSCFVVIGGMTGSVTF
jgi:hypothetical protein